MRRPTAKPTHGAQAGARQVFEELGLYDAEDATFADLGSGVGKLVGALRNTLMCVEMLGFALGHAVAFPTAQYQRVTRETAQYFTDPRRAFGHGGERTPKGVEATIAASGSFKRAERESG